MGVGAQLSFGIALRVALSSASDYTYIGPATIKTADY